MPKPPGKKPRPRSAARPKQSAARSARAASNGEETFPQAFAALLRKRKIRVPAGLVEAPRAAYASQHPSFVDQLAALPDPDLRVYAEKIAGYAGRQAKRAKAEWEASPLIAELRKRKLREPDPPVRVVGASVSLRTSMKDWSDAEIVRAADEWSRMGQA